VLPGVMGVEGFAEAAACVLPGWQVQAVEEVNYLAPFKFYRNEPRTVTITAVYHQQGDGMVADCRLIGKRALANQTEAQETTHFTARVRLSKVAPQAISTTVVPAITGPVIPRSDIYGVYFHGPAYQVVSRAWWDGHRIIGEFSPGLPANHQPPELPTLMAPRLIELCFQTAGVCEMAEGRMALPQHIDHVSFCGTAAEPVGALYAVVTPHSDYASFDAEVVDAAGSSYISLSGYRTVALPDAIDAEPFKALHAFMA
jgi:Polyketide synthase dehydratase